MGGLSFALPPSLGRAQARELAKEFALLLYEAGFETVVPFQSYEALKDALLTGEVSAAWGPPLVCAEIERAGGRVVLQAVRQGCITYRSALVCRANDNLTVEMLRDGQQRRLRAAWVDKRSMGGYLLPCLHLKNQRVQLESLFETEFFAGSYSDCFEQILDCEVDITASYANARGLGYVELFPDEAHHLKVITYTPECPNDGLVTSAHDPSNAADIQRRVLSVCDDFRKRSVLFKALEVDDLRPPPDKSYLQALKWALPKS